MAEAFWRPEYRKRVLLQTVKHKILQYHNKNLHLEKYKHGQYFGAYERLELEQFLLPASRLGYHVVIWFVLYWKAYWAKVLTQRVKGQNFNTTNCCRVVYVGKNVQLVLKNLYRRENALSGPWFCELLSDWSKTLFGSQDLVSGHKVKKKSVLTHTRTLGQ